MTQPLTSQKCVTCRPDSPRVTEAEIAELRPQVPEWNLVERDGIPRLERVFKFRTYPLAVAFANRVAEIAEVEDHHPAILLEWGRVMVTWWTHAIHNLHRNDFIMAAKTDAVLAGSAANPNYIVIVEAAVVHEGRYLLIVRSRTETQSPGMLALPGGKVEVAERTLDVLEQTAAREVEEEVGVSVQLEMAYLESTFFIMDDGRRAVDIAFLCRYRAGESRAASPDEVESVQWLTAADLLAHPAAPPWLRQTIERAERKRLEWRW